jgi:uncharacterized protein YdeI (BOF family)
MLGNKLAGGSGYGARVNGPASIAVATTGNNDRYSGPLARAMVIRGNTLFDQAVISLDGNVTDAIVEGNSISRSPQGIRINTGVTNAVIRNNSFKDVASPIAGEGAARAYAD